MNFYHFYKRETTVCKNKTKSNKFVAGCDTDKNETATKALLKGTSKAKKIHITEKATASEIRSTLRVSSKVRAAVKKAMTP